MNYQQTIDYLYSRLPVFQNIGARAYKPGLHTTRELCHLLGNPQDQYPTIHVGGTNGKGSTSHMLAAILQKAGYKVGLYTSPHLKNFTERIRVNGQEVDPSFVVKFTSDNISNIDRLHPSFFEVTVAMAFSYFAEQKVDVAVIEVGMGGLMDSTNVIQPMLSVITNVSFDHTQYLGDTLVKIAGEKAGIIKAATPVVISEYQEEVNAVFEAVASEKKAPIYFASQTVAIEELPVEQGKLTVAVEDPDGFNFKRLHLALTGAYQLHNIGGVLKAVSLLNQLDFKISKESVQLGLAEVTTLTGLKGRWQKLHEKPLVYCDTGHNVAGLAQTLTQFESLGGKEKRFVIGFVGDKDISKILKLFPMQAHYYFTQPSNARALPVAELESRAVAIGLIGKGYANVNLALQAALDEANEEDRIYVGGSTFVVADLEDL